MKNTTHTIQAQTILTILARRPGQWISHRRIWEISVDYNTRYGTPVIPVPHQTTATLKKLGLVEKDTIDGFRCARITPIGVSHARHNFLKGE